MIFCDWIISLRIMFSRFINDLACTSLLFVTKQYSILCIYNILLMYLSIYGYLSCFQFLAIMHSAIVNICVQTNLFGHICSFLLSVYLGVEMLGHMITLCLTLWGTAKPFYKVVHHFTFPLAVYLGFQFLSNLPNTYCPFLGL